MPVEALVCPYCRTWFEGSGRSVRCPSCSRKFSADRAHLGSRPSAPIEDIPVVASSTATANPSQRQTYDSYRTEERDDDWQTTEPAAPEELPDWTTEREGAAPPAEAEPNGRPNLNTLFTVATLLLLFVGPRVLEPGLILPALLALIAGRWIYGRWANSSSEP